MHLSLTESFGLTLSIFTGAETFHSVLNVDRGLPWQGALKQREEYLAEMRARGQPPSSVSGFYADTRKHGSLGETFRP